MGCELVEVHANPNDGIVHIHGCPEHPKGSKRGGSACFFDEHDDAFKAEHKAKYDAAKR